MIDKNFLRLDLPNTVNIFVVEDRDHWTLTSDKCNKVTDLVLCVDFALKQQLATEGYLVEFVDHLTNPIVLERLNAEMHNFLNNWYKDAKGEDILEYKGYHLGDSILLFLINDISYFCHYFFNIIALNAIEHEKIFVAASDSTILSCLDKAGLAYTHIKGNVQPSKSVYLFPIIKWVKEKTKPSFRFKVKNLIANIFDLYFRVVDSLRTRKSSVYIQNYYPTEPIIQSLQNNLSLQLILPNYISLSKIGKFRRIHYSNKVVESKLADEMIERYRKERTIDWKVFNYPLSEYLNEIIEPVLSENLLDALNKAESTERQMKSVNLKLMIPITNLWTPNRLVMHYCFKNKIPVFMVINGQLNTSYYHDAKDSDYVNCYSISMKENYFENKSSAMPLGDPRMDKYAKIIPKTINRKSPTIIIGAAGYDSIDLNSYLAYEFDFLYDILFVIDKMNNNGFAADIVLKVRGNGYIDLYTNFIKEYFSHLQISIIQDKSFFDVISEADLYVSIFSQTIFEASCLGIPSIYYKKDTQFIHEPFDGKSELVTACNIEELKEKMLLFYNDSDAFDKFLKREVLQKYIGPIDGNNTKRNLDFIEHLLVSETKQITRKAN